MDTYGHLFPGQVAAAVNNLLATMAGPTTTLVTTGPEAIPSVTSSTVQRQMQRAGDETLPKRASRCDEPDPNRAQTKPPKSRPVADLSGVVRPDATAGTSSGGGTRTTPRTLRFGGGFGDPRCNLRRKSVDRRVDCRLTLPIWRSFARPPRETGSPQPSCGGHGSSSSFGAGSCVGTSCMPGSGATSQFVPSPSSLAKGRSEEPCLELRLRCRAD